ncbi:MAG: GspE/PulE family protein [Melioribacteraceae bacterium]|nr:GspE/PulE family protein [Melioribacteraceae bacterium]MCF8395086.1 GspE/PulE family protein [Melioribacteraceae bacterium]MCF8420367.1 GspE/PulE family protein [Melioribacteraceae bacterium]
MTITIDREAVEVISASYAFEKNILPLKLNSGNLEVGLIDKSNTKLIKDIEFDTGLKLFPVELPPDVILKKLKEIYPDSQKAEAAKNITDFVSNGSSNIEYINQVIIGAVKSNASDIHFESMENILKIRYRIDGHLREVARLKKERAAALISRIKIMANMDIAEKRRPQDGKIRFNNEGRDIDIRVSTIPASFGEKTVLRILDKSQLNLNINSLGLSHDHKELLLKHITSPYGMILVTGPTGSGKTTSLYTALKEIQSDEKNILTIEDPVEYNLDGINQCNVKPDIGFTFASALRSFLRQDPDIIMIGEIRDLETAEIAVRSSLTGHLVFSTLHTNDSLSAVTRLIDMGIEPYLVSSSVRLIIAQRLVRKLCSCKKLSDKQINPDELQNHYEPVGCENCGFSGYKGRTALFEFAEIDRDVSEMIGRSASYSDILNVLLKKNFTTLRSAGIEKIKNGITSYEEVIRETSL